jgi:hypothetical protein
MQAKKSIQHGAILLGTVVALVSYPGRLYGALLGVSNIQVSIMAALVSLAAIQRALAIVLVGRTSIVIAHRPPTHAGFQREPYPRWGPDRWWGLFGGEGGLLEVMSVRLDGGERISAADLCAALALAPGDRFSPGSPLPACPQLRATSR